MEQGTVANKPTPPENNVFVNIKNVDKECQYKVVRDGKLISSLSVVNIVGDFGAIMKVNDNKAIALISEGDKVLPFPTVKNPNVFNAEIEEEDNPPSTIKKEVIKVDNGTPAIEVPSAEDKVNEEKQVASVNTTSAIPPYTSIKDQPSATPIPPQYTNVDEGDWDEVILDEKDTKNIVLYPDNVWMQVNNAPESYKSASIIGTITGENKKATWLCNIKEDGVYNVSCWWTTPIQGKLSSKVPVTIHTADGDVKLTIDQTKDGGKFNSLGDYKFKKGDKVQIMTISNKDCPDGTGSFICVDAMKIACK